MRQLKNFLRKKKANMLGCSCDCITLKCWREANCDCNVEGNEADDGGFYIRGLNNEFTMPGTNKTWRLISNSGLFTFTDGTLTFHIASNGSYVTPAMYDDYADDNLRHYEAIGELYTEIQYNVSQDGANAKTKVLDAERTIILNAFKEAKKTVWFDWDGTTFWKNRPAFPLYNVVDYDGNVLGQQWLLETGGKFAYLEGDAGDTYQDYYEALIQAGATKMKIGHIFSNIIRQGFNLGNIASKGVVAEDGFNCYVPTEDGYNYSLSFTNDGILQIVLATAGRGISGVEEGKEITLSEDAEQYITNNWEGWVYVNAIGDEKVLGELAA